MDAEQEQRYIIDRVGEETDLEECSLCFAASCFACVSEHCTALTRRRSRTTRISYRPMTDGSWLAFLRTRV